MRRLCVFYRNAHAYVGKPIDWIVCQECAAKLRRGIRLRATFEQSWQSLAQEIVTTKDPRPCSICLGGKQDRIHHPGYCGPRPHPFAPLESKSVQRRKAAQRWPR